MNTDSLQSTTTREKSLHLEWLLPTLIHPKTAIKEIVAHEKSVWLTPLLALSVLAFLAGLIAGPIRKSAILSGSSLPQNFQYFSSDQQAQFVAAQSSQSSALFTFIFPIIGALLGIWISWFLLSSILHLSLTLTGSRTHSVHSYNLVAWTMLPLAVRLVVQILAMFFGHTLISHAGLSGFVAGNGGAAFLAGILAQVDIYFAWQICLLLYGVLLQSSLTKSKAWGATAFALALYVLLMALPKVFSSLLSGLSLGGLI